MNDVNFWGKLDFGQRLYLGLGLLLCLVAIFCVPYKNPLTQELHWSLPWSPPRYELQDMKEVLSSEAMGDLSNLPVPLGDDFLENSTTEEMRPQISLHRKIILFTFLITMAGWYFVPTWIEPMFHRRH